MVWMAIPDTPCTDHGTYTYLGCETHPLCVTGNPFPPILNTQKPWDSHLWDQKGGVLIGGYGDQRALPGRSNAA